MLKREIIGDRSVMAIEYMVTQKKPYVMGNLILWMNSTYVGAFDDEQMLLNIAHNLENLPNSISINDAFNGLNQNDICHLLNEENKGHLVSLGEGFDDFLIYSYVIGDELYFIWSLLDEPFFTYSSYPKGVQFAKVHKNFWLNVIKQLKVNLLSEQNS